MSNKHDVREFLFRLIRHARSAPGHTPLVHLTEADAVLAESALTSEERVAAEVAKRVRGEITKRIRAQSLTYCCEFPCRCEGQRDNDADEAEGLDIDAIVRDVLEGR